MGKEKKYHSLTVNLVRLICLVLFVSVSLVFLFNFFNTKKMIETSTEKSIHQTVEYYQSQVSNWLDIRIEQMKKTAYSVENLWAHQRNKDLEKKIIVESSQYGAEYGVITDYIVYPDKTMISGDGWTPQAGYDPTQNDYYTKAKDGGLYITPPYIDATTKNFIITISMPVYVNGNFYAVVARDLRLDEIQKMVSSYQSNDGSYLYLLDNEGNVLCHKNAEFQTDESKVVNVNDIKMSVLQTDMNQMQEYKDYDNQMKYFYGQTDPQSGWVIGLVLPESVISNQVAQQMGALIGIFAAAFVVTLFVLVSALRKKLAPIQDVVQAAQKIEKGDFDVSLNCNSKDEIGLLSDTFHNTSEYLKEIIQEITGILDELAKGNLTVSPEKEYRGNFESIRVSVNTIIEQMNHVIGGIYDAADQVSSGSTEVANSAQHLSEGSIEQAAQVESIVEGVSRVKDAVQNNAERCENAEKITVEVTAKLEESNVYMKEMVDEMDKINQASTEIGKIIKTIQDIAFQTNILALNAAVEAARAGAAGRGFAVVADEVRELANKSAQAAQNTTGLIEASIQTIEKGTEVAHQTAQSLQEAVMAAQEVVNETQQIAVLSGEQAREIDRISHSISDFSAVVQTNSATAEENAATSEEMSGQAQTMRMLLSRFKRRH